jgi:hypothetical protein
MEPTPSFFIEYLYDDKSELAEVMPCCGDDNVYYYDIKIKNQYQFTITPTFEDGKGMGWKVSLKNADKHVEQELIDIIGEEIEKHIL